MDIRPIKVPSIVVSLLNRPKEEAIAHAESELKVNAGNYMFRVSNDNIVSFSHSYNFDKGEGNNVGNLITLELVDPENVFERYLFTNADLLMKSTQDIEQSRKNALLNLEERIKLRETIKEFANENNTKPITAEFTNNGFIADFTDVSDYQKNKVQTTVEEELLSKLTGKLTAQKLGDKELAEAIIKKAKEKKVISISSIEIYDEVPPGESEEADQYFAVSAFVDTNALSSIYADFNLDRLEEQKTILPTPYFYFYYGLNNNPAEWTGPVCAAFTDAQYQYSWETGRKSIIMTFTTTFDFPAYSRLALDMRGYNTYLNPKYKVVKKIKATALGSSSGFIDTFGNDQSIHPVICNSVIKEYLVQCTSNKINILVLLPDLDKLLAKLVPNYLGFISTGISGGTSFERTAALVDVYGKIFEEMGFSVAYERSPGRGLTGSNLDVGDEMLRRALIERGFAGFAQESAVTTYAAQGPQSAEYYLGVAITKDLNQSYQDVIQKITNGLKNKLSLVDISLEVIDDLQFVNEFVDFLSSRGHPYKSLIEKDKPILVFGDRYLMQKYLYGKKHYVTKGLIQEAQQKTVTGKEEDLSLTSLQNQYGFDKKTTDDYLSDLDKTAFNDNYIDTIAKKYFLKIDETLQVNSGMYSITADDFSLDSADSAIASLRQCRVPIFKSGLSESNLLNVDLNFNDFYFAALRAVWAKVDQLNLITGDSPTSPAINVNNLRVFNPTEFAQIEKDLKSLNIINDALELNFFKLVDYLEDPSNKFTEYLKAQDIDKTQGISDLISVLSNDIKSKRQEKLRVIVGSHTNTNSYIQYLSLFARLVNNAYIGYIKTLPSFHISGTALSVPPILLLLEEINTIPYNSKSFLSRALNGLYQIIGFKHTITSDDVYSEFFINKSIQLDLPLSFERKTSK